IIFIVGGRLPQREHREKMFCLGERNSHRDTPIRSIPPYGVGKEHGEELFFVRRRIVTETGENTEKYYNDNRKKSSHKGY
ncbi:hypothetical protein KAX29_02365, partial [candidate division WOR-3 bacterium]|nr:hypothetical protein [candidate division WOR-3 bacterium]